MFKLRPYKLTALREWNLRMSRFETPEIFDSVVAAVLESQGFNSKQSYEPRSVYSVEKLYNALVKFDPAESVFVTIDKHVQSGINYAFSIFAKPKDVQPLQSLEYWDQSLISNWRASAGLTAFGQNKLEAFSRGILSAQRILESERKPEPCIALTRTQKQGKTRLVWGYPMSMTLLEGCFARPLLEQFKGGVTPMAFAMTNKTLGAKILSSQQSNRYWYSLDASQFDATIQRPMIKSAFNIIRTWFDLEAPFATTGDTQVTNGRVLKIIEDYFIYTPIVMPTGDKNTNVEGILHLGKDHGVPSGSYFTQLVDSIVNIIILGTLASKFGFKVDPHDCHVLGDDLLFFTDSHLDMHSLANYASSTFGMIFNPAKSTHGGANDEVEFLGRTWKNGIPHRSTEAAIDKMLWPESFRKYNDRIREAKIVMASYNLSAVSHGGLIPNLRGWSAGLDPTMVVSNADKLSGYYRFMLSQGEQQPHLRMNHGSLNMLSVML